MNFAGISKWLSGQFAKLVQISRESLYSGQPMKLRLREAGFPDFSASSYINPAQLCFLHMPKTAGASVINFMDSMFDDADVAKAYNPPDYDHFAASLKDYKFVRGHFLGAQQEKYFPDAECFTILRSPADLVVSMYRWMRNYDEAEWDAWSKSGRRVAGDERRLMALNARAAHLAQRHSLAELLEMHDPLVERRLKRIILRTLTDGMFGVESVQLPHAENWLRRCIAIGDFDDLEMAMWLICAVRTWPAPPPLLEIHVNPTRSRADPDVVARLRQDSEADFHLYRIGSELARIAANRLVTAAGTRDNVPRWLDAQHRSAYLSVAPRSPFLELDAMHAWPGTGWTSRIVEASGRASRSLGPSGRASILAKILPGLHYLVSIHLPRVLNVEVVDRISCIVSSTMLCRIGTNQSSSGISIVWELPSQAVDDTNGDCEIAFSVQPYLAGPGNFIIDRITIQISPYKH